MILKKYPYLSPQRFQAGGEQKGLRHDTQTQACRASAQTAFGRCTNGVRIMSGRRLKGEVSADFKCDNIMAFYKKQQLKSNGKWYPRSVTVGKPVDTDKIAQRLAEISTVSPADTYAVLKALGGVLGDYMAQGRTVKLDGLGTFYYTANAGGQGVDSAEQVSAKQITGVRVRFIPEARRKSGDTSMTRTLISDDIFWEEWGGTDDGSSSGSSDGGGQDDNPLG